MNITIKKSSDDNKIKTIWLPMEEDRLEEASNELKLNYIKIHKPYKLG